MREFSVGRVRLVVLDDGTLPFPAHAFFHNVPESLWRSELETDADGKIPVGHNYGLVQIDDALVVIDTGYGDDTHGGRTGHLLDELARAGCGREQVTHVVNTHAHGDHVKRNTIVEDGRRVPAFPHARYYVGGADCDWFGGPAGDMHEFDTQIGTLARLDRLDRVDAERRLTPEIFLLPTPGHTPGHLSVLIESERETAIFLGDLCHHPLHFTHFDWVSEFDTEPALTPRMRARMFALAVARDAVVICPHAPFPGVGRLKRNHKGYLWQPVM